MQKKYKPDGQENESLQENSALAGDELLLALDENRNRKRRQLGLALLVIAVAITIAIYWLYFSEKLPAVVVERLEPGPVERVLIVSGRTRSDNEARLRAGVSARLAEVLVREGSTISAGQTLIRFDDERARLAVFEAQAALEKALVNLKKAEEDFQRIQALGFAASEAERSQAAKALEAAKAEVKRLGVMLKQAKVALSDYQLAAPFDATVLDRYVEIGEFVTAGRDVLHIADLSGLYIEIEVDEDYSASIRKGQKAVIRLAGRKKTLAGHVVLIEPDVNTVTGAIPVRVALDDKTQAPTGLTAVVNVVTASIPAALTIPRTALISNDPPRVFVVIDGKAKKKTIKIVDWPAERVQVIEGLEAGDLVIIDPENVTDGQPVKIKAVTTHKGS